MKLLNETLQESVNDKNIFKAVFLAGGPGSGKGFILNKLLGGSSISPFGAKVVNSDTFFEFLLNKNNLPFVMDSSSDAYPQQMAQREKAKSLASNQLDNIVNGCLPVPISEKHNDMPILPHTLTSIDLVNPLYNLTSYRKRYLLYDSLDTKRFLVFFKSKC